MVAGMSVLRCFFGGENYKIGVLFDTLKILSNFTQNYFI